MPLHPQAGLPAKPEQLVDLVQLEQAYYSATPDPSDPQQRVSFGTSGHRGSSLRHSFNEAHILAITQAICEYRQSSRHHRSPLHRQGHPCAFRTGPTHRT